MVLNLRKNILILNDLSISCRLIRSDRRSLGLEIRKIPEGGAEMVVTRGEKGSMAYDGEKFYYGGIVPCEVVDTMGAGDSFIAGFLYAICEGKGIQEAMADGAANSSVTIAYSGAW